MRYAEGELTRAALSFNANGSNTLVSATTGKVIAVYELVLYADSAVAATLKSGTTGLTGAMNITSLNLPLVAIGDLIFPHLKTASGEALICTLGAGTQVSGYIVYRKI